jgi:hypothetical protein
VIVALLQIIAYLLPLLIHAAAEKRATLKGQDADANIQEFRSALATDDSQRTAALLADQHDRVRAALRDRAGG